VRRGLYQLRDYPSSPREQVMAAWLSADKEQAVVSHAVRQARERGLIVRGQLWHAAQRLRQLIDQALQEDE
jgi:hypothetical protein